MIIRSIGILGAGRAGTAMARAAASAGIEVKIASSRPPKMMKYHLAQYAPQAISVSAAEITNDVELVVLMVPQEDLDEVNPQHLAGALVIDATNRWQDEPLPDWLDIAISHGLSSSEAIAQHFARSRLVKTLNHISHWDIDADRASKATAQRALAVASDNVDDTEIASALIEQIGFSPVKLPTLASGIALEPDGGIFNEVLGASELAQRITSKYGVKLS